MIEVRQYVIALNVSDDVSECGKNTDEWVAESTELMRKNMFKRDDEKTEVLVISTSFFTDRLHETCIRIGDTSVQVNESTRNFEIHQGYPDTGFTSREGYLCFY